VAVLIDSGKKKKGKILVFPVRRPDWLNTGREGAPERIALEGNERGRGGEDAF